MLQELKPQESQTHQSSLEQVKRYYDKNHAFYLKYLGTTLQSNLFINQMTGEEEPWFSNLRMAALAGIEDGDYVLDAGCGVCGPALDIAGAYENVRIAGVNISPMQAVRAQAMIREAGLESRVQAHLQDFHELSFVDKTFDVAVFFESSGYSWDRERLFGEIFRLLKPGGRVYIKDIFKKEGNISLREHMELTHFEQTQVRLTPTLSETLRELRMAGFKDVQGHDIEEVSGVKKFTEALVTKSNGKQELNEIGRIHHGDYKCLPVYFGDVKAVKP